MTEKQRQKQQVLKSHLASRTPYRDAGFDEKEQDYLRALYTQGRLVIERVRAAQALVYAERLEVHAKDQAAARAKELGT